MDIKKDKKKDKGDKKAKKEKTDKKEKKDKTKAGSQKTNGSILVPNSVASSAAAGSALASTLPAGQSTPVSASRDISNGAAATAAAADVNPKLDICAGCGKNIMGDISHAMNKKWHLYCFTCTTCQVPVNDEFYENEGKPYCRRDFNKLFGASCSGCKKPLAGKKLKALEKEWHPACFVCHKCRKPFPEMEYFDIDQQPYCEGCYDVEEERLLKTDH